MDMFAAIGCSGSNESNATGNSHRTRIREVEYRFYFPSLLSQSFRYCEAPAPANAAFAIPASKMSAPPDDGNLPVAGLMKSLLEHEHLYRAIAEHPEAGIFQRHTEPWSFCLYYLESEVRRCFFEVQQLCQTRRDKRGEVVSDAALRRELSEKMNSLFEALSKHGRSP